MNKKDINTNNAVPCGTVATPASVPGLADIPGDNVDQDGHCVSPAYGESVGTNTGEPCDDGRDGD